MFPTGPPPLISGMDLLGGKENREGPETQTVWAVGTVGAGCHAEGQKGVLISSFHGHSKGPEQPNTLGETTLFPPEGRQEA